MEVTNLKLKHLFKIFGYVMVIIGGMMTSTLIQQPSVLVVLFSVAVICLGVGMIEAHDKVFNLSIMFSYMVFIGMGIYFLLTYALSGNIPNLVMGAFLVPLSSIYIYLYYRDRPKISEIAEIEG